MTEEQWDTSASVAIVGMGLAVPGASSPEAFWKLLNQDHNIMAEPTLFDLENWFSANVKAEDKSYVRAAGFMGDFVPHPRLVAETVQGKWRGSDITTVLLRHCLLQAMDELAVCPEDRFGVYVGTPTGTLTHEETVLLTTACASVSDGPRRDQVRQALRRRYKNACDQPRNVCPDRVVAVACRELLPPDSDRLSIDTACSSSLYAIDLGVKSLLAGERDVVFCGGTHTFTRRELVLFSKVGGHPHNGEVRSFDADASGVLFSDGAATVALKRLDRALGDGDDILGVLGGFGGSVDGQGSVLAPSAIGQRRALRRARSVNFTDPGAVEWIVGHGTGTPAGDEAELETLAGLAGPAGHVVTSNKSLIGHGAWTAGVLSVIHALLAMRHDTIPGQRYFTALPETIRAPGIIVPRHDIEWPAPEKRQRIAGICAYGLGGTNGHLLVHGPESASRQPTRSAPPSACADPMVLVGHRVHLPGEPAQETVAAWLRDEGELPARSFGEEYPLPPLKEIRMPSRSARSVDRTHLMALAVTQAFAREHGEIWERHREHTGVITGHMGATRAMCEYTVRVGAADLTAALAEVPDATEQDRARLAATLSELADRLPAANERSLTGQLVNVIGCTVANRFQLGGATMSLDSGGSSTQAALHAAERYLATSELDVALVLALNGNSTPVMSQLSSRPAERIGEGAVLLVLTRESFAARHGWPVLARIHTASLRTVPRPTATEIDGPAGRDYLGAQGAFALLRAVLTGADGTVLRNHDPGPRVMVTSASERGPSMERSVLALRRTKLVAASPERPAISTGALVLTDSVDLAAELAPRVRQVDGHLLCTDPKASGSYLITSILDTPAEDVARAVSRIGGDCRDVLVVASVRTELSSWPAAPTPASLRLQECVLSAVQALNGSATSVTALLLDSPAGHSIHPHLTLLTGLLRALARELPCSVYAVVTDATLAEGIDQLRAESTSDGDRSVVEYRRGLRHVEEVCPDPLLLGRQAGQLPWTAEPVIVATTGAVGVSTALVTALARRLRPRVWLLGAAGIDTVPVELRDVKDAQLPVLRTEFVSREVESGVAAEEADRRFSALVRTWEASRTVACLRRLCGRHEVHYLICDLRDRTQVHRAATAIYAKERQVDLLIHGASENGTTSVADKSLERFREVRDVKVAGYHHLKAAFADPAPAVWCNLGSAGAVLGETGVTDHAPATEYLLAAARYASRAGRWESTIAVDECLESAEMLLAEFTEPRPAEPVSVYGPGGDPRSPSRLLTDREELDDAVARWNWHPHPVRDSYLVENLIDGRPALPVAMMLAMAAEAAVDEQPGRAVTGFARVDVGARLFTHPSVAPASCRVTAWTVDPEEVRVEIRSDLIAPNGQLLVTDRLHCRVDVLIGASVEPPPTSATTPDPSPGVSRPVEDPATNADMSMQLSGMWQTLCDLDVDARSVRARWTPRPEPDGVFASLPVPVLLIDAASRMLGYRSTDGGEIGIGTAESVERIELFTEDTDVGLALSHPEGLELIYRSDTNRVTATTRDGRVVLAMTGAATGDADLGSSEAGRRMERQL